MAAVFPGGFKRGKGQGVAENLFPPSSDACQAWETVIK